MKFRTGWVSSKLHLCLIGMVLVTWLFFASSGSDAAFSTACSAVEVLAIGYSVSRVGETVAQRRAPTTDPKTTEVP